jgi:hypothetical protein
MFDIFSEDHTRSTISETLCSRVDGYCNQTVEPSTTNVIILQDSSSADA